MSQVSAWKELVSRQFRQKFIFPANAQHNWFPGHMHKGLRDMQRKLKDVDCVIEVHDARIPLSGRNTTFQETINGPRPHILVLNKEDLVPKDNRDTLVQKIKEQDPYVSKVIFTHGRYGGCPGVKSILPNAIRCIEESNRFHRTGCPDKCILVIGIPNVGKSSLINQLRSSHMHINHKATPTGAKPGITRHVQEKIRVSDDPLVYLLDTPGISKPNVRSMHVGMKLAVCNTLRDEVIGLDVISDYLLWWLNKHHIFEYVEYMGLDQPEDDVKVMLAKSALAANKIVKRKNIQGGSGRTEFPDIDFAATKFMDGFRKGRFGLVNLDTDLLEKGAENMPADIRPKPDNRLVDRRLASG